MLLRTLSQHVKDQNWFAVFIDFLIVVIGVFIGIQVANWNDARNAAANEVVIMKLPTTPSYHTTGRCSWHLKLKCSHGKHIKAMEKGCSNRCIPMYKKYCPF